MSSGPQMEEKNSNGGLIENKQTFEFFSYGSKKKIEFTRKELQSIRDRAIKIVSTLPKNTNWKRTYLRLAEVADYLDAMEARIKEKEEIKIQSDRGCDRATFYGDQNNETKKFY